MQPVMEVTNHRYQVFRECLTQTMWPFFEVPLDSFTTIFPGSFNWALLLAVGLWGFTSFGAYAITPKEGKCIKDGYPEKGWHRLGIFWCFVALVWNLILVVLVFIYTFRQGTKWDELESYPMTLTTFIISEFFLCGATLYFLNEFMEGIRRWYTYPMNLLIPENPPGPNNAGMRLAAPLTYYPREKEDERGQILWYGPALLKILSNSYLLDPVILLGVFGASGHLSTVQAWNFFILAVLYRLLNKITTHFIIEAFFYRPNDDYTMESFKNNLPKRPTFPLTGPKESQKEAQNDIFEIRVMALGSQLASFLIFVGIWILVNDQETLYANQPNVMFYFYGLYLIPEVIRILIHFMLQILIADTADTVYRLKTITFIVQVLWIYDIVSRVTLGLMILFQNDTEAVGTRKFLENWYSVLTTEGIQRFAVA
jgi:hypothetical protein